MLKVTFITAAPYNQEHVEWFPEGNHDGAGYKLRASALGWTIKSVETTPDTTRKVFERKGEMESNQYCANIAADMRRQKFDDQYDEEESYQQAVERAEYFKDTMGDME